MSQLQYGESILENMSTSGITGLDINEKVEELTLSEVCKLLGKNIKIIN